MRRLGVIGAGDLGQLVARHAPRCGGWTVSGFFDDTLDAGTDTAGGPVLGPVSALDDDDWRTRLDALFLAVGYRHPEFRRTCFERLSARYPFATLVHESCYVDPTATVRPGAMLLPGCVIDAGVTIEENAFLNAGCVVAHESRVGRHSFFGPAVTLSGLVTIGECCFLGVGTTIIERVVVGDSVRTGGGAVVVDPLTEPVLYVGVPARRAR